jgi:hypothetical protein
LTRPMTPPGAEMTRTRHVSGPTPTWPWHQRTEWKRASQVRESGTKQHVISMYHEYGLKERGANLKHFASSTERGQSNARRKLEGTLPAEPRKDLSYLWKTRYQSKDIKTCSELTKQVRLRLARHVYSAAQRDADREKEQTNPRMDKDGSFSARSMNCSTILLWPKKLNP